MSVHDNEMARSMCGFGFFIGDEVTHTTNLWTRTGFVQWVNRESRTISVRFNEAYNVFAFVSNPNLKRTGNRGHSTLYSKTAIKELYRSLPLDEKALFLYHFYSGGKKAANEVAIRCKISLEQVRKILHGFREKGCV